MKDRRSFPRKYLVMISRVFDRKTGKLLGHIADMTIEGMMIIGDLHLKANLVYELRMELPENIFGINHLDLVARSIWCHHDPIPTMHNTGFQLLELSDDDVAIIERILREYAIDR
jgi:hypothetical protein